MAIEYQNRFGDTYFLQAGKTKTGKPKYYFGKKKTGEPVDTIPAGYEIRENPDNAQVTLRKVRPTENSPMEKDQLCNGIRERTNLTHFIVDADGDSLVVYVPDMLQREAENLVARLGAIMGRVPSSVGSIAAQFVTRSRYSPMMRFTLTDPDERLFCLERWCFLGSIDNWLPLAGPTPLSILIEKYVEHLGQESFYELV